MVELTPNTVLAAADTMLLQMPDQVHTSCPEMIPVTIIVLGEILMVLDTTSYAAFHRLQIEWQDRIVGKFARGGGIDTTDPSMPDPSNIIKYLMEPDGNTLHTRDSLKKLLASGIYQINTIAARRVMLAKIHV